MRRVITECDSRVWLTCDFRCQHTRGDAMIRMMSTTEIIAELPRLSAAELALVQAKLRELVEPHPELPRGLRIHTPRLAQPDRAKDFIKQVVELSPHAPL